MYQGIATKVMTGEARLSYVHLCEKYANPNQPGSDPAYSCTLLIPKTDTATKANIDASIKAAYEQGVQNKWKGARPQMKNALIYDGDGVNSSGVPYGPECKGHWVLSVRSKTVKPQCVHVSAPTTELAPTDVYSGMYARVTINFYPFDGSQKGVAAGLGNVFKTRDGEPLGGGASAASEFADIANEYAGKGAPAGEIDHISGLPLSAMDGSFSFG